MNKPFNLFQNAQLSNGNTIDDIKKKFEIDMLKKQITETDYKVIKCHEYALVGKPLPYDIEALHAERQAIRDKINEFEGGS